MPPIGPQIASIRVEKQITQTELSRRSGIPQANLSKIERGAQDPTVSTLLRICSSLGVSPLEVFQERPSGESLLWTRSALERVARAVMGSSEKLKRGEKEIVELLKDEIPGRRRRLSSKRVYQSWLELKQRLSRDEIRALIERIQDVEQRLHEKNLNSPIF